MIKLCGDYLRLILFCSGLLIGIQIPAVVDQYAKRIDAHLTEAEGTLAGFQQTADRYFSTSIQGLIQHYKASDDPVFKEDANNIRLIFERVRMLENEQAALNQSAFKRMTHVLFFADDKIFQQAIEQYSYVILINPQALLFGVVSGFLLAALLDALLMFGIFAFRRGFPTSKIERQI
jgi:hypothetical protein